MPRKLVVCCDGTWNKPRDETNVYRTYKFLQGRLKSQREVPGSNDGWCYCEGKASDGSEVVLYYDKGVGTGFGELLRGGAFGQGLSDNVRDAYHFLSHHQRPGDALYVFGFSRGAYTARSLCGFINRMGGLLENPSENDVLRAYLQVYALNNAVVGRPQGISAGDAIARLKGWLGGLAGRDIDDLPRRAVTVRFVGVYDTVGALGVPVPSADRVNQAIVGFHDTDFCPIVEHGVQALAVDERRGPYAPTLWRLPRSASLGPGQSCLQVWFPGVHSDIGGGYRDKGIGNITLDFMLCRAAEHGLVIDEAQPLPSLDLERLPTQHDSLDGLWGKVGRVFPGEIQRLRPIGSVARAQQQNDRPEAAGREMLHASLLERLGQQVNVIEETDGAPQDPLGALSAGEPRLDSGGDPRRGRAAGLPRRRLRHWPKGADSRRTPWSGRGTGAGASDGTRCGLRGASAISARMAVPGARRPGSCHKCSPGAKPYPKAAPPVAAGSASCTGTDHRQPNRRAPWLTGQTN